MAIFQTFRNLLAQRREDTSQRPGQNTAAEPDELPPRPDAEDKEGDFFLGADMVQHEERRAGFAAVSLDDLKDDRDFYILVRRKLQAARALSKANGGTFEVPSDVKLAKLTFYYFQFFFLPSKTDVIATIPYDECSDNPFTPPRPYYHGTNKPSSGTPELSSETTAEIWDLLRWMDPDIDKAMRIYFQILGEYIRDGVRWPDSGTGLTSVLNMLPRRPSPPALERKPWVKEWCFHASYAPTGRRQGYLWAVAIGGMLVSVLFAAIWLWRVDAKDLQNASTVFLCFAAGFAMLQMIWAQRS
ncbi:hypothetical protein F5X68DRAFT_240711 [Plectosphaerella plurivora]|uniref:Uncharacterized protein n=1 Tax=Plectosphaerella plurivora TaxID=936078 RepID=A0A9P9AAG7_9PEZI|nr:hypothetical protein F5X68DRAFT_240711 [Plectosphaerella plurivora]